MKSRPKAAEKFDEILNSGAKDEAAEKKR